MKWTCSPGRGQEFPCHISYHQGMTTWGNLGHGEPGPESEGSESSPDFPSLLAGWLW